MRRITRSSLLAVGAAGALAAAVAAQAGDSTDKVYICHGTASDTNPYVLIHVSMEALPAHLGGHGFQNAKDFIFDVSDAQHPSCAEQADDDGGPGDD
jgi:ABC-type sugar transport system substrate-binding protein